jgi:hypothetical protein
MGWTLVLHTWKRDLGDHPHIHALVTAGGLSLDGSQFRQVTGHFLFSGEVMGILPSQLARIDPRLLARM